MKENLFEWQDKLTSILFESKGVTASEVCDAIDNRYRVLIQYDDETEKKQTGTRLIEPYVYGLTTLGNDVLRAYQYYGSSRRGIPKYKLFRLDRIISWTPQPNNHFFADPKNLGVAAPAYNNNGDDTLSIIFKQVHFNQSSQEEPQDQTFNVETPLDRVKQQKTKNIQKIDRQVADKTKTLNNPNKGSLKTNSLEKELKQGENKDNHTNSSFEQDMDSRLGIQPQQQTRGAIKVSNQQYDSGNKTNDDKRNQDIMRKRDNRWQQAADNRQLWRKDAANADIENTEEQ